MVCENNKIKKKGKMQFDKLEREVEIIKIVDYFHNHDYGNHYFSY